MKNEKFSHENRPDIHEDFGLMNIFHENFLRCRPSKSPMNIRERYSCFALHHEYFSPIIFQPRHVVSQNRAHHVVGAT